MRDMECKLTVVRSCRGRDVYVCMCRYWSFDLRGSGKVTGGGVSSIVHVLSHVRVTRCIVEGLG
jgi:hypothetical protein